MPKQGFHGRELPVAELAGGATEIVYLYLPLTAAAGDDDLVLLTTFPLVFMDPHMTSESFPGGKALLADLAEMITDVLLELDLQDHTVGHLLSIAIDSLLTHHFRRHGDGNEAGETEVGLEDMWFGKVGTAEEFQEEERRRGSSI